MCIKEEYIILCKRLEIFLYHLNLKCTIKRIIGYIKRYSFV